MNLQVMFMDEAVFHMDGSIIRYNYRIWGLQQPNKLFEYIHETPNVEV
jgi:hypothetical protein